MTVANIDLLVHDSATVAPLQDGGSTTSHAHMAYDAFGNLLSATNGTSPIDITSLTRYLYTSREFDAATGLQYNRARWFDQATGGWISIDPMSFVAGDGNLYRYVRNEPTDMIDSSGLNPNQFGARDADKLIERVKYLEHTRNRSTDWRRSLQILLDDMLRPVDAQSNHYYVFASGKGEVWVDVRHFTEAAIQTAKTGVLAPTPAEVVVGGNLVEFAQWASNLVFGGEPGTAQAGTAASRFGVEDKYSNYVGAVFASRLVAMEKEGKCFKLSEALEEELPALGWGKISESKSFDHLPRTEREWQEWRLDPKVYETLKEQEGAMVYTGARRPISYRFHPPLPPPTYGSPRNTSGGLYLNQRY